MVEYIQYLQQISSDARDCHLALARNVSAQPIYFDSGLEIHQDITQIKKV